MLSLAIQKAVKGKLLNVEVAVLATLVVVLLIYVHLLFAKTTLHLKTACRCFLRDLNLSMWVVFFKQHQEILIMLQISHLKEFTECPILSLLKS